MTKKEFENDNFAASQLYSDIESDLGLLNPKEADNLLASALQDSVYYPGSRADLLIKRAIDDGADTNAFIQKKNFHIYPSQINTYKVLLNHISTSINAIQLTKDSLNKILEKMVEMHKEGPQEAEQISELIKLAIEAGADANLLIQKTNFYIPIDTYKVLLNHISTSTNAIPVSKGSWDKLLEKMVDMYQSNPQKDEQKSELIQLAIEAGADANPLIQNISFYSSESQINTYKVLLNHISTSTNAIPLSKDSLNKLLKKAIEIRVSTWNPYTSKYELDTQKDEQKSEFIQLAIEAGADANPLIQNISFYSSESPINMCKVLLNHISTSANAIPLSKDSWDKLLEKMVERYEPDPQKAQQISELIKLAIEAGADANLLIQNITFYSSDWQINTYKVLLNHISTSTNAIPLSKDSSDKFLKTMVDMYSMYHSNPKKAEQISELIKLAINAGADANLLIQNIPVYPSESQINSYKVLLNHISTSTNAIPLSKDSSDKLLEKMVDMYSMYHSNPPKQVYEVIKLAIEAGADANKAFSSITSDENKACELIKGLSSIGTDGSNLRDNDNPWLQNASLKLIQCAVDNNYLQGSFAYKVLVHNFIKGNFEYARKIYKATTADVSGLKITDSLVDAIINGIDKSTEPNKNNALTNLCNKAGIKIDDSFKHLIYNITDNINPSEFSFLSGILDKLASYYINLSKHNLAQDLAAEAPLTKDAIALLDRAFGEDGSQRLASFKTLKDLYPNNKILARIDDDFTSLHQVLGEAMNLLDNDFALEVLTVNGLAPSPMPQTVSAYRGFQKNMSAEDMQAHFLYGYRARSAGEYQKFLGYYANEPWTNCKDCRWEFAGTYVSLEPNMAALFAQGITTHRNSEDSIVMEVVIPANSPQMCGAYKDEYELIPSTIPGSMVTAFYKISKSAYKFSIYEVIKNPYAAPGVEPRYKSGDVIRHDDEAVNLYKTLSCNSLPTENHKSSVFKNAADFEARYTHAQHLIDQAQLSATYFEGRDAVSVAGVDYADISIDS